MYCSLFASVLAVSVGQVSVCRSVRLECEGGPGQAGLLVTAAIIATLSLVILAASRVAASRQYRLQPPVHSQLEVSVIKI